MGEERRVGRWDGRDRQAATQVQKRRVQQRVTEQGAKEDVASNLSEKKERGLEKSWLGVGRKRGEDRRRTYVVVRPKLRSVINFTTATFIRVQSTLAQMIKILEDWSKNAQATGMLQ